MPNLRLSLAISDYAHTRSIADGRIQPAGIELVVSNLPFEQAAFRFGANLEFDISEFSLANYCALVAGREPSPMVAIPVFPSRVFRHSSIYVTERANIKSLADLAGRKVGIPQWSQTATIYIRGYLMHQVGIALSAIRWVQAGLNQPGRREPIQMQVPADVKIEKRPDGTLSNMLVSGEIEAAITARPPRCFEERQPGVARLFPDYRAAEESYFKETGIFPIMHVIAMRRQLYEAHPWVARNLYNAFSEAKRETMQYLRNLQASFLPTAWAVNELERVHRMLFPQGEPWPYGLEPNRATLEPFLAYCYEQGVTRRQLKAEELFPKEVTFEVIV